MANSPTDTLVFGVHGMGAGTPGWSKELFDTLDEAVATFNYASIQKALKDRKVTSVSGLIDFVEVSYGDVFQDLIKNWATNAADAIKRAATLPERDKVEKAVGWLQKNGEPKDDFVWTHLMDVFFWLSSSYVRSLVKNNVAKVMTEAVANRRVKDKGYRYQLSLVAHSLGTTVARETLEDLYGGGWQGTRWEPGLVQFDSYHAIANVSQLMNFSGSSYEGFVRPGPSGQTGVLYFNCYHNIYDPFTVVRPFSPPDWSANLFDNVKVQHIRQINVHAISHYVAHPSVHIRILRQWLGYFSVSQKEEQDAQEAFPDIETNRQALARDAIQVAELAERNLTLSPDLVDILKTIVTYAASTKSAPAANNGPKTRATGSKP